jgi:hypothetical protein
MEEKAEDRDAQPQSVNGIGSLGCFSLPAPDTRQATIGTIGIGDLMNISKCPDLPLTALLEFDETAATMH